MATPSALSPGEQPAPVIRVLDSRRHPSLEAARTGKTDMTFSYMYGAEGPFTVTVPYEDLARRPPQQQNDILKKHIATAQAERLGWKGREIPIA